MLLFCVSFEADVVFKRIFSLTLKKFGKMLYYNFLMLASLFSLTMTHNNFKNKEIEVALEVFKELKISHCMLVVENPKLILFNRKEIYKHNIFIAHVQKEYLNFLLSDAKSFSSKIGFILNIKAVNILKNLFEKDPMGVSEFTWMMLDNKNIGQEIIIPYNCRFLIVESGNENQYLVKEIYHVKSSGPFCTGFGVWSRSSGLVLNNDFNEQRKDMRGVKLIRGDSYPFAKGTACTLFSIENRHREIWVEYSRLLNFSLVVVNETLSNDPSSPDGTPCAMIQHSLNYFPEAVYPTCFMPAFMVIKFESDLGEGWKSYFKPFGIDLWLSTFGFVIISALAFMIIGHFTKTNMNPFAVLYSFCDQDGIDINNERFANISSLIAYLMPYIAATVIVPAYSAAILAKLTIQLPQVPFTDLETFAQDGTYKISSINRTFVNMYFMRNEHPLISRIYQKMYIKEKEFPNVDSEAINILCNRKKFAFIPYHVEKFEKSSSCKLYRIPKKILHLYCGFRMRMNSPFQHVFRKLLIGLYTNGVLLRVNETVKSDPTDANEEIFEPITFSQILPILNLIPLGIFLSAISFVTEIFRRKSKIRANHRKFTISKFSY